MMIFFKLLKINFQNTFSKNTFGNTRAKKVLLTILIIYSIIVLGFTSGFMFYSLAKGLNEMNQINSLIYFLGVYSLILPLILTLFRASGTLFFYKDYSILGPLPIKPRTIFASKLVMMMFWIYLGSLIFAIPIIIFYFYFAGFSLLTLLYSILGFLILPLVPVIIMSFISLLIGYVSAKFRIGKIIHTILLFLSLIAVFAVQFAMSSSQENPLSGQQGLMEMINKYYLPLTWFNQMIVDHDILSLIYLVGSHVIVFFIFILAVERISTYLNKNGIRKNQSHLNKKVIIQTNSLMKTLVKKEFAKFFSIPIYIMNVGFGIVLIFIASIASIFYSTEILLFVSEIKIDIVLVISLISAFFIILTYTPAVSLSLEGKNFWLVKSLPIKPEKVMYAKVVFNLLLILPIYTLSLIILTISLGLSITDFVAILVYVTSISVASSLLYALVNLYFPKFDFATEQAVVKQSLSAFLASMLGMALVATSVVIYRALAKYVNFIVAFTIIVLLYIGISIAAFFILKHTAPKQFRKYQA